MECANCNHEAKYHLPYYCTVWNCGCRGFAAVGKGVGPAPAIGIEDVSRVSNPLASAPAWLSERQYFALMHELGRIANALEHQAASMRDFREATVIPPLRHSCCPLCGEETR